METVDQNDYENATESGLAMEKHPPEAEHFEEIPHNDNGDDEKPMSWQLGAAVISLALGFVAPIATIGLVASVVAQLSTELGDTKNQLWVVGAFSVSSAVAFAIAGSLSDIFGRRYIILVGNLLAIIGCIVAATAQKTLMLVAGEAIIGFACGLIIVGYASVSELLPNKWRGAGIAVVEFFITMPWVVVNTLLATSIYSSTALSWRWFYIIGALYATISLIGVSVFYFPPSRPSHDYEKTRWQQFKGLDFLGYLLFAGGLCVTLIGISWADSQHSWTSAAVLAPLIIGICSFIATFVYDFTIPTTPLFPKSLMREFRRYTIFLVIAFVSGFIYYSMSALLPQAALFLFTSDPTQIGITQIPNGIGQLVLGSISSAFIGWIGHLRLQLILWVAVMVTATVCMAATIPNHKAAFMAVQFFAIGPFPVVTALSYVMASLNVPLRHLGVAFGLVGTFRSVGGSMGNAILQTVLNSIVKNKLPSAIIGATSQFGFSPEHMGDLIEATVLNAVGVPFAFASVPGVTPEVEKAAAAALKGVYAYAFRRVFYTIIPFGVIAIACTFLVDDPSLHLTNHTAVHMEKKAVEDDIRV